MYLLDTNACIAILNRSSQPLIDHVGSCSPEEIGLSSVVKAELYFGARRSNRVQENLEVLARFFAPFRTYPFDDLCAEHYGSIRADLVRSGNTIGPNDLLIAATARAHDLTLVTNKTREFSRVVGLRLEDWQTSYPG
jgi:tRNA(fMet)-specific endonuclease VapC